MSNRFGGENPNCFLLPAQREKRIRFRQGDFDGVCILRLCEGQQGKFVSTGKCLGPGLFQNVRFDVILQLKGGQIFGDQRVDPFSRDCTAGHVLCGRRKSKRGCSRESRPENGETGDVQADGMKHETMSS